MKKPITKTKEKKQRQPKQDWKDMADSYDKYKKYIKSKEWEEVKEYLFTNVYERKCYFCGREEGEDNVKISMHHNSYRHLYDEKNHPEDVLPLCNVCHLCGHKCKFNFKRFKKN